MSEYQFTIGDFAPRGPVDPKFQVKGVAPTNHSFSQKTRLNDLSYGMKNLKISLFCLVTMYAFDRQTDRRTDIFLFLVAFHAARKKYCQQGQLLIKG